MEDLETKLVELSVKLSLITAKHELRIQALEKEMRYIDRLVSQKLPTWSEVVAVCSDCSTMRKQTCRVCQERM